MPLSEYEQRVLEQMERQLRSDDPKLASTLHGRAGSATRTWLIASIGGLAGLGMLIGGAASGMTWLGVLGFVTMFGAALAAFSRPRKGPAPVKGAAPAKGTSPAAKKGSFLSGGEERWERRPDQR